MESEAELYLHVDAFSSCEPGSTSLENAIERLPIAWARSVLLQHAGIAGSTDDDCSTAHGPRILIVLERRIARSAPRHLVIRTNCELWLQISDPADSVNQITS
jgi:hypothetical protein